MKLRDLVPWSGAATKIPVQHTGTPFSAFHDDMSRMMDEFFRGFPTQTPLRLIKGEEGFRPVVDVEDSDQQITVKAELPGMEQQDVHLTLDNNHLLIEGERKLSEEREENGTVYRESSYGSFKRVIPFEVEIDEDNVDASMKNGVLTIVIPKASDNIQKRRKISVRAE